MVDIDQLIPADQLLRKVKAVMDWSFIYLPVEDKHSRDTGHPSLDPVVLVKKAGIQYLFGCIHNSMSFGSLYERLKVLAYCYVA